MQLQIYETKSHCDKKKVTQQEIKSHCEIKSLIVRKSVGRYSHITRKKIAVRYSH